MVGVRFASKVWRIDVLILGMVCTMTAHPCSLSPRADRDVSMMIPRHRSRLMRLRRPSPVLAEVVVDLQDQDQDQDQELPGKAMCSSVNKGFSRLMF